MREDLFHRKLQLLIFFTDESLVREVEASGFIKALYETEYR